MKKLFTLISIITGLNAYAQISGLVTDPGITEWTPSGAAILTGDISAAKPSNTLVNDTLQYFFNKHYFRNPNTPSGNPPNLQFYTLKSPYPGTLNLSHYGSVFLNNTPITITGLRALVIRNAGSVSLAVPFRLYLCNVNASNQPVFPPIDSVQAAITGTGGIWSGGTFTTPVNISSNFAVIFRTSSTIAGDTVRLFLNNANTATSTAVSSQRYGEGLGRLRFNGNWQANTNAFGAGTDYEFVVAPFVSYNFNSLPVTLTPTICNLTQGSFTNNSTPMNLIESRFFNLNKFKPYWAPTNSSMPAVTDSIYTWNFFGSSTPSTTSKNASAIFNTLGTQTASLTVRIKSFIFNTGADYYDMRDGNTASIDVNNGSAPPLTVTGNTYFCSNGYISTTLTAGGASTYTWSNPIAYTNSIVVSHSSSAVYTVMSSQGGCTAIRIVTVAVYPLPSVLLTASAGTVCNVAGGGSTVTLTGNPIGGFYTGTNVSGNKFTPNTPGTFTAAYSFTSTSTGCSNTATVSLLVLNCTSLGQQNSLSQLAIFPNPAVSGKFLIKGLHGSTRVEIYNLLGSLMQATKCETEECAVDISALASGHYFVKVTDLSGNSKTVKIVNQN